MKGLLAAVLIALAAGALTGCERSGETGAQASAEGNAQVRGETSAGREENTQTAAMPQEDGLQVQGIQAVYPEMAPYPDEDAYFDEDTGEFDGEAFFDVYDVWWEEKRARMDLPEESVSSLYPFFESSMCQFLAEEIPEKEGENKVYSPLNVYMALSMLAEITDGGSRQQILNLLGADSIESLRMQAGQVWDANYSRDGAVTSVLANSLWLDQGIPFKTETLNVLAENYYASSYWGQMGSDELDQQLQSWLNQQTEGLLEEQASGLHLTGDTLMALTSAICFRAKWSDEFMKSDTGEGTFHGSHGDTTCDFMHQSGTGIYYWGEKFAALNKSFQNSGGMWLILPDEGITPEEVLLDGEMMKLFFAGEEWENRKSLMVNLAMPKFDVVSGISLKDGLIGLGVTDVFDPDQSDFTPLAEGQEGISIAQASHAARVVVDEEGCIAAAYTVMAAAGGAMPREEEINFVLDRPFIFVITSDSGLPLFAGIVSQP